MNNLHPPWEGAVLSGWDECNNPKWESKGFRLANTPPSVAAHVKLEDMTNAAVELVAAKMIGEAILGELAATTPGERARLHERVLSRCMVVIDRFGEHELRDPIMKLVPVLSEKIAPELLAKLESKVLEFGHKAMADIERKVEAAVSKVMQDEITKRIDLSVKATVRQGLDEMMRKIKLDVHIDMEGLNSLLDTVEGLGAGK